MSAWLVEARRSAFAGANQICEARGSPRSPFGATEAEAVGKFTSQSLPKLLPLVFGHIDQLVVVPLHLLVELLDVRSVAIISTGAIVVALLGTAALLEW